MPLVPTATYTAWYSKTSWVYSAFSYLFQNQLWSKPVPKGFSLCPLFWLALFSLAILRPFVLVVLGARFACRLLRLNRLIEWTDSVAVRIVGCEGPFMCPTIAGLFLAGCAGATLTLFGVGIADLAAVGMVVPGVAVFTNALVGLICSSYCSSHRNDPDRCSVEWYLRASLALTLTLALVFHPTLTINTFIGIPLAIAKWLALSAFACAGWCWSSCVYLLVGIVHASFWAMVSGGVFLVLLIAGYLASCLYPMAEVTLAAPKVTRAQYRANLSNLADWLYYTTSLDLESVRVKELAPTIPAVVALHDPNPESRARTTTRVKWSCSPR